MENKIKMNIEIKNLDLFKEKLKEIENIAEQLETKMNELNDIEIEIELDIQQEEK